MNKLPVSIVSIKENLDSLEIKEADTFIEIEGNVKINELKILTNNFKTSWLIKEHSSLTLGCILEIANVIGTIEIENLGYSSLTLHLGISAKQKNFLSIQNKLSNNHSTSEIKVRITGEEDSHTTILTRGILKEGTLENTFLEDVKYLVEETSYIECIPELLVSTNECVANHNVTIGSIDEDELFYLTSKGISEELSKGLIRDCFIKSMLIREEE